MTREDIMRLAREAGMSFTELFGGQRIIDGWLSDLERFAALVAAAKEQEMRESGWRQCAKGQRTTQFCGQLEAAVAAEREEIAAMFDAYPRLVGDYRDGCLICGFNPKLVAEGIRARGK